MIVKIYSRVVVGRYICKNMLKSWDFFLQVIQNKKKKPYKVNTQYSIFIVYFTVSRKCTGNRITKLTIIYTGR